MSRKNKKSSVIWKEVYIKNKDGKNLNGIVVAIKIIIRIVRVVRDARFVGVINSQEVIGWFIELLQSLGGMF